MKKKILVIAVMIIILLLVGVGFFAWNNKHKEAISFCENDCKYRLGNWRFSTDDSITFAMTFFHTKKECIDVCIDFNYFLRAFKRIK